MIKRLPYVRNELLVLYISSNQNQLTKRNFPFKEHLAGVLSVIKISLYLHVSTNRTFPFKESF